MANDDQAWVVRRVDPVRGKNDFLQFKLERPERDGVVIGVAVFGTHEEAERAASGALAAEYAHHPESVSATYTVEEAPTSSPYKVVDEVELKPAEREVLPDGRVIQHWNVTPVRSKGGS